MSDFKEDEMPTTLAETLISIKACEIAKLSHGRKGNIERVQHFIRLIEQLESHISKEWGVS